LLVPGRKCHGHDEQAKGDRVVLEVTMIDQNKARVQGWKKFFILKEVIIIDCKNYFKI
jgi:hypothetical protein